MPRDKKDPRVTWLSSSDNEVRVEVAPAFGFDGWWSVTAWARDKMMGLSIQPEFPPHRHAEALEMATHLCNLLAPNVIAQEEYRERKVQERRERDEKDRPAREKKEKAEAAKRAKQLAEAKEEVVHGCHMCEHIGPLEDFQKRLYECGTCGANQDEDTGNRCETCHRFMAKVADLSCPDCSEPFEVGDEPDQVIAAKLPDGEWVYIDHVNEKPAAGQKGPVVKPMTLAQARRRK